MDVLFHNIGMVFDHDAQPEFEPALIGVAKVAAFGHRMLGTCEHESVITDRAFVVKADDGEEIPKQGFKALVFAAIGRGIGIKEPIITARL